MEPENSLPCSQEIWGSRGSEDDNVLLVYDASADSDTNTGIYLQVYTAS
jgi:hypothetical protein